MKNKNIFIFISASYTLDVGRGGVAEVVSQLESELRAFHSIKKLALYGVKAPGGADSTEVMQSFLTHSPEFGYLRRVFFWFFTSLVLLKYIFENYRAMKSAVIVSCSPGPSHILAIFFSKVIIWENVSYFSKRRWFDYFRLLHFVARKCIVVVPTVAEFRSLKLKFPSLNVMKCHDWYSSDVTFSGSLQKKGPLRLVAAGALEARKGFDLLIESVSLLSPNERAGVVVDIYGEGPLRRSLELKINELGLLKVVNLKGFASDLIHKFHEYDMFVLSSRYEGFPLVLVNALASGLPALAFDGPTGASEVLVDGLNGRLLPAQDKRALADSILYFSKNFDGKFNRINCRQSVDGFSLESAVKIWRSEILFPDDSGIK